VIPRTLHIIWIGDPARRPAQNIESWRRMNPAMQFREWGNADLTARGWRTARHMKALAPRELSGVADLMRYEILLDEGGVAVDADSLCLRALDDFILEHDPFASWEQEITRPGLISCAFVGASAGNDLLAALVDELAAAPDLTQRLAWQETGPLRFTRTVRRLRYANLTIFPSHFFMPRHYTGIRYDGPGRVYSDHQWASAQRLIGAGSVLKPEFGDLPDSDK
jgi:mannosyltransferase OCH1-like enzyme